MKRGHVQGLLRKVLRRSTMANFSSTCGTLVQEARSLCAYSMLSTGIAREARQVLVLQEILPPSRRLLLGSSQRSNRRWTRVISIEQVFERDIAPTVSYFYSF